VRIRPALWFVLFGTSSILAWSVPDRSYPDALAGRWEASDGQGGAIGMNILITATVAGSTTDLIGVPQKIEDFVIAVYQRPGSDAQPLDFNWFTTSPNGGATWNGRHMKVDFSQKWSSVEIHVDLAWNDKNQLWVGTFERGTFKRQRLTLRRPAGRHYSSFVGTWFDSSGLMNDCVHIAQAEDGTFTAWGDDIQVPGRIRYANGIRPPERAMEHYGEIAKVKVTEPDHIEVELRAYIPICCSHPFIAAISPDGNTLIGRWPGGPNQAPQPVKWTRVPGNSCVSSASHR
jgi:hypothetical protein